MWRAVAVVVIDDLRPVDCILRSAETTRIARGVAEAMQQALDALERQRTRGDSGRGLYSVPEKPSAAAGRGDVKRIPARAVPCQRAA